jgi:subtilisin family serine protease
MAESTKSPKRQRKSQGAARSSEVAKTSKAKASSPKPAPEGKPGPISLKPPTPKTFVPLTVAEGVAPRVQTIIYIHGIGNKPVASVLKCQWDAALFGVQLGDRSRMAYWVNREYYPTPQNINCGAGDVIRVDDDEVTTRSIMALAAGKPTNEQDAINAEIESLTDDPERQAWLKVMSEKMIARTQPEQTTIGAADVGAKVLPLPPFLRRLITQKLTRAFLRDVNDFFFNAKRREEMEQSLIERLNAGGGPFVVIAHSQGTMIADNVLRRLTKAQCDVRLLVTMGSPLGLDEVQDVLKQWTGGKLPVPACVDRWVNVADWLDPVAADSDISNEYTPKDKIENFAGFLNPDSPQHPHSATGYLKSRPVKSVVQQTVGNAFGQAVGQAVIAKDLVENMENGYRQERHMTLIQLSATATDGSMDLAEVRQQLTQRIEQMVTEAGDSLGDVEIEPLKRFVAARLTRLEIEQLRTVFKDLQIERVWQNAAKRALIYLSTNTVQARPANLGYGASGRNIGWAVLDTGIRADHPHFQTYHNIVDQWDCTKQGAPLKMTKEQSAKLDKQGHGTHVAGVIAGWCEVPLKRGEPPVIFAGMAPETKLYGFKVLDDQGGGRDSWIIKALDLIADINDKAGKLIIQGVNLSLGGDFDPSVYGCGHTPLCQELRRLWNQGVLVVLAAGNEGYALLETVEGSIPANLDLSIGDPANLDEAIAVGSIHKTNPHTYGISYFSSRGPTADGRRKPDLVAPGEQILSAYHNYIPGKSIKDCIAEELYIEMSGTSMAAPHVSGMLAAFLSMRREFIGYSNQVKTRLLENCTDLKRDPYIQGYGVPNLIRMLANS